MRPLLKIIGVGVFGLCIACLQAQTAGQRAGTQSSKLSSTALPTNCSLTIAPVDFSKAEVAGEKLSDSDRQAFEKAMAEKLVGRLTEIHAAHVKPEGDLRLNIAVTRYDPGFWATNVAFRDVTAHTRVTIANMSGETLDEFEIDSKHSPGLGDATQHARAQKVGEDTANVIGLGRLKQVACLQ